MKGSVIKEPAIICMKIKNKMHVAVIELILITIFVCTLFGENHTNVTSIYMNFISVFNGFFRGLMST